jgi:transposase
MPKILRVRKPQDEKEEGWVRKMATSRHGPADWIAHARMVVRSWDGERVEAIAKDLGCSALTVRRRLHRFDAEGIEGLGDHPKPGRPRRLTVEDDSKLIALVRQPPPGRLVTQADGTMVARDEKGSAQWSLNALAQVAKEAGIAVKRSQIRTILRRERVKWRHTHSWGTPRDKDFVPKERRLSPTTPTRLRARQPSAPLDYERGPEKTWVYGALRVRDGKELTRCAASRNSKGYIALLADIEADNPTGDIYIISDNLSSHNSLETTTWLSEHPPRLHSHRSEAFSIFRRGGGASSAVMRWPAKVLLIPKRSSKPPGWRPFNSMPAPSPGSGDALLRIIASIAEPFVTAFHERS